MKRFIPSILLVLLASTLTAQSLRLTGQSDDLARLHDKLSAAVGGDSSTIGILSDESLGSCSGYSIACGQTATHASLRCQVSGVFVDDYDFQATAGQTVTASASSTYLFVSIHDSAGNPVAVSPSPPSTFEVVSYTFPSSGLYTIRVYSSYNTTYTLTVSCSGGAPPPTCTSSGTSLCLNGARFRVSVIFSAPSLGITNAPAQAVPLTSDTGYFWFFSANNVEIVLKAVDGRSFNNYFWVFYGALSDVEYTITVTDTVTGAVRTYSNPPGHLASVADTSAFDGSGGSTPANLSGSWTGTISSPTSSLCNGNIAVVFSQTGSSFSGNFNLPVGGSGAFQGSINGAQLGGVFTTLTPDGCAGSGTFNGTLVTTNQLVIDAPTVSSTNPACQFCQQNTVRLSR
jgi:hypothetical protein